MAKIHGAVAAGHPKTAEAGIEMLRLGGNVFDAVVAGVLASCAVEPTLTSLAGGGFLLAHTADDRNILFDFFTQTPRQKKHPDNLDFYPVNVNFGSVLQEFHIGLGSMGVPGTFGGLFDVHQKLGRLPFQVVTEPAIDYARHGVELGEFQAFCLKILEPILLGSPRSRQIYAPQGHLLQIGETLAIPDLADTLDYLAETGTQGFYQGEIAQRLVKDCQDQGGYLTLEDMSHYQVIERSPLITHYRGRSLITNPPPSSGGILIAFALSLLSDLDLPQIGFGTINHLQALAQIMHLTNRARKDGYDVNFDQSNVAENFLSPEFLSQYVNQLQVEQRPHPVNKLGSTTHLSAIDSEGNAASVTSSNGEGSSYVIPHTGIMVNNMLGEADLHPNGFHQWQENVRISSMMAPTMLLRDHRPEIVLGSGGSNRIRTAILQVISNIIDFQMPIADAVNCSRIHWEDDVFNIEPGFSDLPIDRIPPFNSELLLNSEILQWKQHNMFFGGVHTVMEDATGLISGTGDRRRSGSVAIC
jgi:gamma-glutamyltranspeptidase / glutathione hydrolase